MPPRKKNAAAAKDTTKQAAKSPKQEKTVKSPKNTSKAPSPSKKAAVTPKNSSEKRTRTRKSNDKKGSTNFMIAYLNGLWSKTKSVWKTSFGHLPFVELVILLWFIIDALTHLVMEATYVYAALFEKWDGWGNEIWKKYGEADKRWYGKTDPTIVSLEVLTVVPVGLMCAWAVYCTYKKMYLRHLLIVIISTAELYGGWMTFFPAYININFNNTGKSNLVGMNKPILFWIYLVFMNGLWVIVPAIFLYLSSNALLAKKSSIKLSTVDLFLVRLVLFVILLYIVLVPVILIFDWKDKD